MVGRCPLVLELAVVPMGVAPGPEVWEVDVVVPLVVVVPVEVAPGPEVQEEEVLQVVGVREQVEVLHDGVPSDLLIPGGLTNVWNPRLGISEGTGWKTLGLIPEGGSSLISPVLY